MGKLTGHQIGALVRYWPPGHSRRGELAIIESETAGKYQLRDEDGELIAGTFRRQDLLPMAHRITLGVAGGTLLSVGGIGLVLITMFIELRPDWTATWGSVYPLAAALSVCVVFAGVGMLRIATDPLAPRRTVARARPARDADSDRADR